MIPRILLVLLFLASPALAEERWPVARGPSHEPFPHEFDRDSLARVPGDFLDDASACILLAATTHLVEADGTVEVITHEVTRLNGRKAIADFGEFRSISFEPSHEQLTLNLARVHKADGRVLPVQPRHVHLRDLPTDYEVYDPSRQLVISFPLLEVGDVIEVKWTVRGKHPEHEGQFFTRYPFGALRSPIVRDELCVRLPKEMPLKWTCVHGDVRPELTEKGGERTYRWITRNRRALPRYDNLPEEELRPVVACSTFTSWQQVGEWKQRRRARCWACTRDIAALVAKITRGLSDPTQKARALTLWARKNLRYVATGIEHDYTPHPPAQVLANRFGDCKDTSQLLAVMLRQAGLTVELASLGVRGDGQVLEKVPSPWSTHALLLVTIEGKQHWIDTTESLAPWDFLPPVDRGRLCYLTDPDGHIRLLPTPPMTASDNRYEQTTEMWISADGTSSVKRVEVSAGLAGVWRRDDLMDQPEGERRRKIAGELQESNSRSVLQKLCVDEKALQDFDQPVTIRLEFEIPGHFTGSPRKEGSFSDPIVWDRLLGHNLPPDRQVPLRFYAPFESRHRFFVHLPAAYTLDYLPEEKAIHSRWCSFTRKVRRIDSKDQQRGVEIEIHTRLEKTRLEPGDLAEFRNIRDGIFHGYRVWLALRPIDRLEQAQALQAWLARTPEDVDSALILAQLYQGQGMKSEARQVVRRTLGQHPKNEQLLALLAALAKTPEEEEQTRHTLVHLFPENKEHVLDLAAFLISQGQQEEARSLLGELARKGSASQRTRAHYQLARSYYRRDELPRVLEHLKEARQIAPESVRTVQVSFLEAQTHEEMGQRAEAMRAYRRVLQLESENRWALQALVRLALEGDDRAEALHFLRRYSVTVGDDVSGLLQAADYYLQLGREGDAFELAQRARNQHFHERTQRILGLIHLKRGESASAIKHLEKAELDATVLESLLTAYLLEGKVRGLRDSVDRAAKLQKIPPSLSHLLSEARQVLQRRKTLLGQLAPSAAAEEAARTAVAALVCAEWTRAAGFAEDKVMRLLTRSLSSGVKLGPAHALRGRLALGRGELSRALTEAEQAVRLSPEDAGGYLVRGKVRLEREQAGALEDLEKAVHLSAGADPDALYWLAQALDRANRQEEALVMLRRALAVKPKAQPWREQLKEWESRKEKK
jgi:tetratricopeptide (TPR) repeat protein